jgi:hypothetical protein
MNMSLGVTQMRTTFAIVLLTTLSIGIGAEAGAALVTYKLNDVTFDDGGTATGFFVRDTSNSSSITKNFDIKVTAGSRLGAFEYSPSTTDGGVASVSLNIFDPTFPLSALFLAGSTTAGRHIELGLHDDPFHPGVNRVAMDCLSMLCSADLTEAGLIRFVTGGTVSLAVSVPESSTLAFVGLGVGLLGFFSAMRKKRHRFNL